MGSVSSMKLPLVIFISFFSLLLFLQMGYSSATTTTTLITEEDHDQYSLTAKSGSPAPSPSPNPHQVPLMKRSLVAVQGVVYCKPCKYQGVGSLLGASPLSGAVVRLQCNNSKYPIKEETKTDKNGYFLLQASKNLTNYGAHKCKMYLVSAPSGSPCNKPTDLHMGLSGAILMIKQQPRPPSTHAHAPVPAPAPAPSNDHGLPNYTLYTVGPFAFDPATCPHY